jgi:hypothetical protein
MMFYNVCFQLSAPSLCIELFLCRACLAYIPVSTLMLSQAMGEIDRSLKYHELRNVIMRNGMIREKPSLVPPAYIYVL